MYRKQRAPLSAFLSRFGTGGALPHNAGRRRLPKMRAQTRLPPVQRAVSVYLLPPTDPVTDGTVPHHSHVSLRKWFLTVYLISQDKCGIPAIQLSNQLRVTYKTAWSMLRCIRSAVGQQDAAHILSGIMGLNNAYWGGSKASGKRGLDTEMQRFS